MNISKKWLNIILFICALLSMGIVLMYIKLQQMLDSNKEMPEISKGIFSDQENYANPPGARDEDERKEMMAGGADRANWDKDEGPAAGGWVDRWVRPSPSPSALPYSYNDQLNPYNSQIDVTALPHTIQTALKEEQRELDEALHNWPSRILYTARLERGALATPERRAVLKVQCEKNWNQEVKFIKVSLEFYRKREKYYKNKLDSAVPMPGAVKQPGLEFLIQHVKTASNQIKFLENRYKISRKHFEIQKEASKMFCNAKPCRCKPLQVGEPCEEDRCCVWGLKCVAQGKWGPKTRLSGKACQLDPKMTLVKWWEQAHHLSTHAPDSSPYDRMKSSLLSNPAANANTPPWEWPDVFVDPSPTLPTPTLPTPTLPTPTLPTPTLPTPTLPTPTHPPGYINHGDGWVLARPPRSVNR